jgi:hypothetical protein
MSYLQQEAVEPKFQNPQEFLDSYRTIAQITMDNMDDIIGKQ